ncbi:MAG: thioredoxin family protein [Saprospiraceae bacterium]
MNTIPQAILDSAMTYTAYRQLTDELLAQNKTTGLNQSEALLHYTKLNVTRMNRLDKTTVLTADTLEKLADITEPQIWLVLTEAWCGDAAQVVPVMNKLAEANPNIILRFILRDENPAVMDAFLTNGTRSIPKLIAINPDTLEVFATWGPRPQVLQDILMPQLQEIKQIQDPELRKQRMDEWKTLAQSWYNKDKTQNTQADLLEAVLEKATV